MEYYNEYINKHMRENVNYDSEICFLSSPNSMKSENLFFITFKETGKQGFFKDVNEELSKMAMLSMRGKEINSDVIYTHKLNPYKQNYSFIKIIRDDIHPELVGKIMLFKFGPKILHLLTKENKKYTLNLIIEKYREFKKFDNTHFSSIEYEYKDDSLNINDHVKFETLNIVSMQNNFERKKKLKYLQQNTNLKKDIINILKEKSDDYNNIANRIMDLAAIISFDK